MAEYVIDKLKQHGFKLQRYDSYSTNSIYIKLDYGVCNSIRISDHSGKKHLSYRYNLMMKYEKFRYEKTPEGWYRYYYPFKHVDRMIQDIIAAKEEKLKRMGPFGYAQKMQEYLAEGAHKKGFWQQCIEIN